MDFQPCHICCECLVRVICLFATTTYLNEHSGRISIENLLDTGICLYVRVSEQWNAVCNRIPKILCVFIYVYYIYIIIHIVTGCQLCTDFGASVIATSPPNKISCASQNDTKVIWDLFCRIKILWPLRSAAGGAESIHINRNITQTEIAFIYVRSVDEACLVWLKVFRCWQAHCCRMCVCVCMYVLRMCQTTLTLSLCRAPARAFI